MCLANKNPYLKFTEKSAGNNFCIYFNMTNVILRNYIIHLTEPENDIIIKT